MLVAVAATMALGACATNDVGKSSGRLTTATALQSLVGSPGSRIRLALDAGPVGLAPGEVADYMDRQEAELRTEMAGTGVDVARIGQQIQLTLPGDVTFTTNSSDIRSDFFGVLNGLSRVLSKYDQTVIEVTGHTDTTGGDGINQPMSERRADAVAMYLRSQRIDNDRLSARGMGSKRPVAPNDTATGRAQNRRIEVLVTPVVAPAPDAMTAGLAPEPAPIEAAAGGGDDEGAGDQADVAPGEPAA